MDVDSLNYLPYIMVETLSGRSVPNVKNKAWVIPVVFTVLDDSHEHGHELALELYDSVNRLDSYGKVEGVGWVVDVPRSSTPYEVPSGSVSAKDLHQFTFTADLLCREAAKQ
jgi:cephalosporin hydroxylase